MREIAGRVMGNGRPNKYIPEASKSPSASFASATPVAVVADAVVGLVHGSELGLERIMWG